MSGEGAIRALFERQYGRPPTHFVRAPGRVNLIGEHIDYCGLSVLPMAIRQSVGLAFAPTGGDRVRLATTIPELEDRAFRIRDPIASGPPGDWGNYPRAAVQALLSAGEAGSAFRAPAGFDGLVSTDLPIASGLSSSSALVVATALAASASGGDAGRWRSSETESSSRLALAELLAEGERYVGTAGGGMDQAVCLLGRSGCALRIGFRPLRVTPVPFPRDWRLVVAHSGERAEKSGAAQAIYNLRTREADGAARRAAEAFGLDPSAGVPRLLEAVGEDALHAWGASSLPDPLRARFRHIVTEAGRVARLEVALRASELEEAGALLLSSHASLRDDYQVSTPRLDALVEAALAAGAVGARLTGAGLGGSIIALCRPRDRREVASALAASAAGAGSPPFLAVPAAGAEVRAL